MRFWNRLLLVFTLNPIEQWFYKYFGKRRKPAFRFSDQIFFFLEARLHFHIYGPKISFHGPVIAALCFMTNGVNNVHQHYFKAESAVDY